MKCTLAVTAKGSSYIKNSIPWFTQVFQQNTSFHLSCCLPILNKDETIHCVFAGKCSQLVRLFHYFTRTMEEKYGSSMFSCCSHNICLRDFCNRRHSFEATDLMFIVHFNINLLRPLEEYRNKSFIKHCRIINSF